jgi:hypothetical protein
MAAMCQFATLVEESIVDKIVMYFAAVLAFMGISLAFVQFVEDTIYINTFLDLAKENLEGGGKKREVSRKGKFAVHLCNFCKNCVVKIMNSLRSKFTSGKSKKKSDKEIFSDYVRNRGEKGLGSPSVTDFYAYKIRLWISYISLAAVLLGVIYLFLQKDQVFHQKGPSLSWPGFVLMVAIVLALMFGVAYFFWRKKLVRKIIMQETEASGSNVEEV